MDAFWAGPQQILPVTPTRYGHWVAVQSEYTLRNLNKETACIFKTKSYSKNHIKKTDRRSSLWLCVAAELSLTEQNTTGDSVVLLVASSTASQFHCT